MICITLSVLLLNVRHFVYKQTVDIFLETVQNCEPNINALPTLIHSFCLHLLNNMRCATEKSLRISYA